MILTFIHIPKTGGTTVESMLFNAFGPRHMIAPMVGVRDTWRHPYPAYTGEMFRKTRALYPALRSISGHNIKPWLYWGDDIQYWTILREPIARAISHYQYFVNHDGADAWLEQWAVQNHDMQCRHLSPSGTAEESIDIIGRRGIIVGAIESLDDVLRAVADLYRPGRNIRIGYLMKNTAANNVIARLVRSNDRLMSVIRENNAEDEKLYAWAINNLARGRGGRYCTGFNNVSYRAGKNFQRFVVNKMARLLYPGALP